MSIEWLGGWSEATIPPHAVAGGVDRDGSPGCVARALHEESLIPGTWRPTSKSVWVRSAPTNLELFFWAPCFFGGLLSVNITLLAIC